MTLKEIAGGAYEWETGNVIVERFKSLDPLDCPGVLINPPCPVHVGRDRRQGRRGRRRRRVLRPLALMSLQLEPKLKAIEPELLAKHFKRKHGPGAYCGQAGSQ